MLKRQNYRKCAWKLRRLREKKICELLTKKRRNYRGLPPLRQSGHRRQLPSKPKSKKDKGEKKDKSKGSTEEKAAEDATPAGTGAAAAPPMEATNLDFEAGRLFERSDRNHTGYIDQVQPPPSSVVRGFPQH